MGAHGLYSELLARKLVVLLFPTSCVYDILLTVLSLPLNSEQSLVSTCLLFETQGRENTTDHKLLVPLVLIFRQRSLCFFCADTFVALAPVVRPRSMIENVKEPEWLPTTHVDHRFTTHPLTETTFDRRPCPGLTRVHT